MPFSVSATLDVYIGLCENKKEEQFSQAAEDFKRRMEW